ncbi:MAG: MmcB family DNA repair protein [Pseudomonadota bacterium]
MSTRPEVTVGLTRSARRYLAESGFWAVPEFVPERGKRVDLCAVSARGEIWVIEVKSGLADFQADTKWTGYLGWADRFFFCVEPTFPMESLPTEEGLIVADAFGAEVLRTGTERPLAPARRKALMIRIARQAAARLQRLEDPGLTIGLVE